jgi:pantoate--beta-alanine ligase
MDTVASVAALRAAVAGWRTVGARVALVPTMGNLHAGHFALVDRARRSGARVVASVFVNPTQFGPGEDFGRYPRTPAEDARGLAEHGCDLLFQPEVAEMYPFGPERCVRMQVPGLTDVLCGASRPGHFDGVATVVSRLFNMAQPDLAVFGAKDFQQLQVIRYLVRDLSVPVAIEAVPIVRDPDGLAMSSRNRYLDPGQRRQAAGIHRALLRLRERFRAGTPRTQLEAAARDVLTAAGFEVDYVEVRREADLAIPADGERAGLRAFAAARLGRTRLIDNLPLD